MREPKVTIAITVISPAARYRHMDLRGKRHVHIKPWLARLVFTLLPGVCNAEMNRMGYPRPVVFS